MVKYILVVDNAESKKYFYYKLTEYLNKNKIKFIEIVNIHQLYEIKHLWKKICGIILSGSDRLLSEKQCVHDISKNIAPLQILDVPVLGICYGFQILNMIYGGKIKKIGQTCNKTLKIKKLVNHPILDGLDDVFEAKCYNNDNITVIADPFHLLCKSRKMNQGFFNDDLKLYGFQFHPESYEETQIILDNFIRKICGKNLK